MLGPKETPCPPNLVPFPYHSKRDQGHLWCLLAYQCPCWPLGSLPVASTCYRVQGASWLSQLLSPCPYPKFLQLMDFPPLASHSFVTLPCRLALCSLFCLSHVAPSLLPVSLGLFCPHSVPLTPAPHPSHNHVQSTGQAMSIAFSPCSGAFQKPLAVLSLQPTVKTVPLNHTWWRSCPPVFTGCSPELFCRCCYQKLFFHCSANSLVNLR